MDNINITKAKYFKSLDGKNVSVNATIDGQDMSVPMDTDNRHYTEILKQVKAGTLTIQEAD